MDDIRLVDVSASYDGTLVFQGLNATLASGRVHVLLGPSGAGKTTISRLLLGLMEPSAGSIAGTSGLARAAVFQENRLAENLSPVANVRLAAGCTAEQARDLLSRLGLADVLSHPVRELSGGQARRVALARAALAKAELICMDEPLSGLDASTKEQVARELLPYLLGKTVLWITHDADDAALLADASVWRLEGKTDARMVPVNTSAART